MNNSSVLPGNHDITRRKFLWVTSMSALGVAAGCATNPVTGESQLMLVSEDWEVDVDRQNSPHQFSADYGTVQDTSLNHYIDSTGKRIASLTHRPQMPYSFRVVNANYVNAYAFPGGSIAATRGILLTLDNEAQLSALLGHELGHVNARHTAEQMSKGIMTQLVVGGLAAYVGTKYEQYGELAAGLGMLGAGMLLASYSRDNERQADDLGMEYMVKGGYSPKGMVGLMDMLQNLSKNKPNAIELMFSTHPMSDERYQTAVSSARTQYPQAENYQVYRERYMDNTSKLRAIKGAVDDMQKGESAMGKKQYNDAESLLKNALQKAPGDYTGLVLMSKCLMIQQKYTEGERYADEAKRVYPQEAQAHHLSGYGKMKNKLFAAALEEFATSDRVLPGNPNTSFYKGMSYEGMQRKKEAAQEYQKFLQAVQEGDQAKYANQRLVEWGYIQKQAPATQQQDQSKPLKKKRSQ